MAIIRWNPMVSRWWRSPLWDEEENMLPVETEGLDVYETEKGIEVKAPLPGIKPEQVEVTYEDGLLRITAKAEETEEEKKKKKVVYRSQRIVSFDYTTTLPRAIDSGKIEADLEDGILVVTAPIAPEAKPKKIAVKTKAK